MFLTINSSNVDYIYKVCREIFIDNYGKIDDSKNKILIFKNGSEIIYEGNRGLKWNINTIKAKLVILLSKLW